MIGHAVGTEPHPDVLARARAAAVIEVLVAAGVARNRLALETGSEPLREVELALDDVAPP